MMLNDMSSASHALSMTDRNFLMLSGIKEVIGFDEQSISVLTQVGQLVIEGQMLHIEKLNVDSGDLSITGEIVSLTYKESVKKKKGIFQRLFG